ncbi:MAG TPA: 4-oxalomesaconate tautomerase [Microbacteriaceae bacterium]|nr:4-oxalomesaconate tautomerase [Microbacteriaceae bacterium]
MSAASEGIPAMLMRGGTSKGAFFLAEDLPAERAERDRLLLEIMGSPDPTQIDGVGGAHPLRSKVAVVSRSAETGIDLDYLFLQVSVDEPLVADSQTCGNIIAGVGPFALERGLIQPGDPRTSVTIRLVNTGDLAVETFATPGGRVEYAGDTAIDGVPGTAAPIEIAMGGAAPTKPVLPTGRLIDVIDGHEVTLVDNGMPVVLLRAEDFGVAGDEKPADLEAREELRAALESIRLRAGELFGLGNVTEQTVPKLSLLSPPREGGAVATRTFIPHRVHTSIGVLMAASVAAGISIPGTVADGVAVVGEDECGAGGALVIEHPSGSLTSTVRVARAEDGRWLGSSITIRTARKLFDGRVFPRP